MATFGPLPSQTKLGRHHRVGANLGLPTEAAVWAVGCSIVAENLRSDKIEDHRYTSGALLARCRDPRR